MTIEILLASKSPFRAALMKNAGLDFKAVEAKIDERAVEATFDGSGATPEDVALVLGEAKALDVSDRHANSLVIGCDQTLSLDDEIFHKAADMDAARRQLLKLSGKTHELNSAVVIARGGEILWRHVGVARMTMRALDPGFIGRYLARIGDTALSSVGCYQIEGVGLQLFEKIDGDYFTIVGLPMLPLLAKLREIGAIDG